MIPLTEATNGKQFALFGLGKAGSAMAKALQFAGTPFFAWDDGETARQGFAYQEHLCPIEQMPWKQLDALILSPGIPLTHPEPHPVVKLAQQHGCPIVCDVEMLYRACPEAKYVGITGTNGKSTTTALVGHILTHAGLNVQTGGNIGVPVMALEPLASNGIYVLELSSYQLDLLDHFHARIGVLLNITPDHLDRHGGMEGYCKAKARMFRHQGEGDTAVIDVDGGHTRELLENLRAESDVLIVPLSLFTPMPVTLSAEDVLRLPGSHNQQNIRAAWYVCKALGLSEAVFRGGVRSFPGLAHRMERIASANGITYINDSKATNCDAAIRALAAYKEGVFWIAGGRAKGDDVSPLVPYLNSVEKGYFMGEAANVFEKGLASHIPCDVFTDMQAAMAKAVEDAARYVAREHKEAIVLLSPACASFDQWRDFEARGDGFRSMAQDFAAKPALQAEGKNHVAH